MLLLLMAVWPSRGRAQMPDLLDISAQYIPSVELRDPKPTTTQLSSYDGTLNVPLPLGARTFLVLGANYHVESASFAHKAQGFQEPARSFHSVEAAAMLIQLLPNDWSITMRVAPGLAADRLAFDEDLARVSALVMATKGFSRHFVLGGGGLLSYSFGSLLPLPALYLEYKPVPALRFETFLPAFAQLLYTVAGRVEVGVRADVSGNSYGIRDPSIAESYPCRAAEDDPSTSFNEGAADPAACFDHVAYSLVLAGAALNVRLFGDVWLSTFFGHSLYRRFDTLNAADRSTDVAGGGETLPNNWFLRCGLTWRLPSGGE